MGLRGGRLRPTRRHVPALAAISAMVHEQAPCPLTSSPTIRSTANSPTVNLQASAGGIGPLAATWPTAGYRHRPRRSPLEGPVAGRSTFRRVGRSYGMQALRQIWAMALRPRPP